MAELKTKVNKASVEKFLKGIEDKRKQEDCFRILEIMQRVTKSEPEMWGTSIIGFGRYQYKYASGHGGEWFLTGFSPRKQNITLYIMSGFEEYDKLLKDLGKYSTGKSCLYIKKLEDVDPKVLKELVTKSVRQMKQSNA